MDLDNLDCNGALGECNLSFSIFFLQNGEVGLSSTGAQSEESKYPNFFEEENAVIGPSLPNKAEDEEYPNFFGKRVDAVPAKTGI